MSACVLYTSHYNDNGLNLWTVSQNQLNVFHCKSCHVLGVSSQWLNPKILLSNVTNFLNHLLPRSVCPWGTQALLLTRLNWEKWILAVLGRLDRISVGLVWEKLPSPEVVLSETTLYWCVCVSNYVCICTHTCVHLCIHMHTGAPKYINTVCWVHLELLICILFQGWPLVFG